MKDRHRVCCYITRGEKLLVYSYKERYTEGCVGTLVVGGGVDTGEVFEDAATREAFEETGLVLSNPVYVGKQIREALNVPDFGDLREHRYYYWLEALATTPDAWEHEISAGELDKDMILKLKFVPFDKVDLSWEFDALLAELKKKISSSVSSSL